MTTLSAHSTTGPVNGQARVHDFVHYCDLQHRPGTLYVVVDVDDDESDTPEYLLTDLTTWKKERSDLLAPGWTFHARPNTIVGLTMDYRGNSHTWHIGADPNFADPEVTERRILKRHFAMFGTPGRIDHWYWTRRDI